MASVRSKVQLQADMFGVTVNVESVVSSTVATEVHWVCTEDHDPVQVKRAYYCPKCQNQAQGTFHKAADLGGERLAVLPDELLRDLTGIQDDASTKKAIAMRLFSTAEVSKHVIPAGSLYYLVPSGVGQAAAYAAFARFLADHTEYTVLTQFSLRGAPNLWSIRSDGTVLSLQQMARPEAMRPMPKLEGTTFPDWYVDTLGKWAEQVAETFDPTQWVDPVQSTLDTWAQSQTVDLPEVTEGGNVSSLMEKLAASVQAAEAAKAPVKEAKPKSAAKPDMKAVRAWAQEQNMGVPAKGRLAKAVVDAYLAAHPLAS